MKYIYPRKINTKDLTIIEIKDRFLIKNKSLVHIFGIIIPIKKCSITKAYNKFNISLENDNLLKICDDYLKENIKHYSPIILEEKGKKYISVHESEKIKEYHLEKVTDFHINIHYVKKSGFLNIPSVSIL